MKNALKNIKRTLKKPWLLYVKYTIRSLLSTESPCLHFWIKPQTMPYRLHVQPYNWGDYMNIVLGKLISGRGVIPYEYVIGGQSRNLKSILMLGSIVPWGLTDNTEIWGAGWHYEDEEFPDVHNKPKVYSVRGPLTRQMLLKYGIECPKIYGDPILLLPRYYKPMTRPKYKYGVVYHFTKKSEMEALRYSIEEKLQSVLLINPNEFKKWTDFIDRIRECEIILSSSLHGLIVADAYRVPNVWICISDEEKNHGYFKYHDYFLSVKRQYQSQPKNILKLDIEQIKQDITLWHEPEIDLDMLLNVCPFKEKK